MKARARTAITLGPLSVHLLFDSQLAHAGTLSFKVVDIQVLPCSALPFAT